MAESNVHLVYGGGRFAFVGVRADAALAAGGPVTGAITHHLNANGGAEA
ncbi:hypothetical protein [Streptomyces avermitilis]